MSNFLNVEFMYSHPEIGRVAVEARYQIQKPDFYSREGDWDYNGFQELEYCAVYKDGKQICVDIPEDVMYHNLRYTMRNAEISGCFSQERGEF